MGQLEYRILGPLDVRDGERQVSVGAGRHRALLAILLLNANRTVSSDGLIDGLWGEQPPKSATPILQGYVSQLRKLLEPQRTTGGPYRVIVTDPAGYRLTVEPGQLDLHRFERLADEGRGALARGRLDEASQKLREALSLWQGPALPEFAYESFAALEIGRLEELRLAALEERIEADLALGRHAELAGELEALIAQQPRRERLCGQLMLALYRSMRQGEALETYQETRRVLVDELGIEPSPALQRLEKAILVQDASLELETAAGRARATAPSPADRSILVVLADERDLDALLGLAEPLATAPQSHEIILAGLVPAHEARTDALARATRELEERREALRGRGVAARAAAFASVDPGADIVRLSQQQGVDLLLLDGRDLALAELALAGATRIVFEEAPCDVALLVRGRATPPAFEDPVLVPFGGGEHDWAALELGAWMAGAHGVPLRLAGVAGDPGEGMRDASRLLASASLAVQQLVGIAAEPLLVASGSGGIVQATDEASMLVLGLSSRWRQEGLGSVRREIADKAQTRTFVVRRGVRPGGLTPPESLTRFTWSLAGAIQAG